MALEGLVVAEVDPGGMLRYTGLIGASGHSVIRVLMRDRGSLQGVRDELRTMGCTSEWMNSLIPVDFPPTVAYPPVREYLDRGVRNGAFEYEEGGLADEHR